MATIKLNAQNKILTKNGKVSCGCCRGGEECCMYPAAPLLATPQIYTYEDLPDELDYTLFPGNPVGNSGILTKISPPYIQNSDFTFFYEGSPFLTRLLTQSEPILAFPYIIKNTEREVPDRYWFALCGTQYDAYSQGEFGSDPPDSFRSIRPTPDSNAYACSGLIGDWGGLIVEDQFADTYTVQIIRPDDDAGTFIVTRRSLCEWSSEIDEFGNPAGCKLRYVGELILPGIGYNWYISKSSYLWFKDGFANTPVGDYGKDTAEYAIVS